MALEGSVLSGNTASGKGGALLIGSVARLVLRHGTSLDSNTADYGGAVAGRMGSRS